MSWLSGILGLDAQHNSAVANQDASKLRKQGVDSYQNLLSGGQADASAAKTGRDQSLSAYQQALQNNPLNNAYQTGQSNNSFLQQFAGAGGINLPGQNGAANPYANQDASQLTPAQSALLNSNIGNINRLKQSAISDFTQHAQQRGLDPSAVEAQSRLISETYDQHVSDVTNQFQEQARHDRLNTLNSLIGQGQQAYGQNLSGQLDLSQIYGNQYNQAVGNQFNATAGIGGVSQQQAQNAQNYAQQGNAAFGNLLELGGFFTGGGFKSPSSSNSNAQDVRNASGL